MKGEGKENRESGLKSFSQFKTMGTKDLEKKKRQITIADRFTLKSIIGTGSFYKEYRGIDLTTRKYVTIYIKPFSKEKSFSKNAKEELREKTSPPIIWHDSHKIDNNYFDIEVHRKFGPSFHEIAKLYRNKISDQTFFLLAYQCLKLIDRIDGMGFGCRTLSPKMLVFSEFIHRHEVYFSNTFDFEKKDEESSLIGDPKYYSIATHLHIKISAKDTIESLCYVLIDFYFGGSLFSQSKKRTEKQYLQLKTTFKPQKLPKLFIDFFCYVKSLNHNEEIKFSEWKRAFKKEITEEVCEKPYEWIKSKSPEQRKAVLDEQSNQTDTTFNFQNFLSPSAEKRDSGEDFDEKSEQVDESDNALTNDESFKVTRLIETTKCFSFRYK